MSVHAVIKTLLQQLTHIYVKENVCIYTGISFKLTFFLCNVKNSKTKEFEYDRWFDLFGVFKRLDSKF